MAFLFNRTFLFYSLLQYNVSAKEELHYGKDYLRLKQRIVVRASRRLLSALPGTVGGKTGTYRDMGSAAFTVFERKQTGAAL